MLELISVASVSKVGIDFFSTLYPINDIFTLWHHESHIHTKKFIIGWPTPLMRKGRGRTGQMQGVWDTAAGIMGGLQVMNLPLLSVYCRTLDRETGRMLDQWISFWPGLPAATLINGEISLSQCSFSFFSVFHFFITTPIPHQLLQCPSTRDANVCGEAALDGPECGRATGLQKNKAGSGSMSPHCWWSFTDHLWLTAMS